MDAAVCASNILRSTECEARGEACVATIPRGNVRRIRPQVALEKWEPEEAPLSRDAFCALVNNRQTQYAAGRKSFHTKQHLKRIKLTSHEGPCGAALEPFVWLSVAASRRRASGRTQSRLDTRRRRHRGSASDAVCVPGAALVRAPPSGR